MVEAARWIVEVLVSEQVHVVAAFGFVHLSNLGQDKQKELCEGGGGVREECENETKKRNQTKRKENIFLADVYIIKFFTQIFFFFNQVN